MLTVAQLFPNRPVHPFAANPPSKKNWRLPASKGSLPTPKKPEEVSWNYSFPTQPKPPANLPENAKRTGRPRGAQHQAVGVVGEHQRGGDQQNHHEDGVAEPEPERSQRETGQTRVSIWKLSVSMYVYLYRYAKIWGG